MSILGWSKDDARQLAQSLVEQNVIYGVIGIKQSTGAYTLNTRSDNLIAVTTEDYGIMYVYPNGKALVAGAPVELEKRGNTWRIVAADTRAGVEKRTVDNQPTTWRGSGNEAPIDSLLINEGLVRQQASSMLVQILPAAYLSTDGTVKRTSGIRQIDLTASIPGTSGQRRYVVIVLDRSDGTISAINGTAKTSTQLGNADIADAATLVKQHETPLAFVELANGDTTVYWNRIIEGRLFAPGVTLPTKATVTTSTYSVTDYDTHVFVNYAGAVTITLPAASDVQYNRELVIKDISGAASGNNITINRAGSDTIDGGTSTPINTDYGSVRLITDSSTSWSVI